MGFAFVDAAGGRDVGVVAAEGDADVTVGADQVVGGVEGGPSQVGDEGFDPGVGRAFDGAVFLAISLDVSLCFSRFGAWNMYPLT